MPERIVNHERPSALNAKERCALAEFLAYIEDRVRDQEPICAKLVRMARLALADPGALKDPSRVLH